MNRKRRIIVDSESDEDSDVHILQTPAISKSSVVPDVSLVHRAHVTAASTEISGHGSDSDPEGEWQPADIKEAMNGMGDDMEVVPWKVTAEQIGDHGIEYCVAFQNGIGTKKYTEWITENDLSENMRVLKDHYEKSMATRRSHKKARPTYAEQDGSGTESSAVEWNSDEDDNEGDSDSEEDSEMSDRSPSSASALSSSTMKSGKNSSKRKDKKSTGGSTQPALPSRRSARSSASTRRAVTRQKLDDLMELRQRSKQGIGALHDFGDSDSDDDDEGMAGRHQFSALAAAPNARRISRDSTGASRGGGNKLIVGGGVTAGAGRWPVEEEYAEADSVGSDNFIVNSDEEDVYAAYSDPDETSRRNHKKKRRRRRERVSSGRAKRSHVGDDDDDDDDGGVKQSTRTSAARSKRVIMDDDDDEDGGSDDDDDDVESSSDEVEEVDELSLYRRLDVRDAQMRDVSPLHLRKSVPVPEALATYVEMLAMVLTDAVFAQTLLNGKVHGSLSAEDEAAGKDTRNRAKYLNASRVVENLICTSRESLIGSSAWKGPFFEALCGRPFYAVQEGYASKDDMERCEACSRSSSGTSYRVHLFGPSYNSSKLWDSRRWVDFLPTSILLYGNVPVTHSPGISSSVAMVSLSDGSEDEDRSERSDGEESSDENGPVQDTVATSGSRRVGGSGGGSPLTSRPDGDQKVPWWKRRWPQELLREPDSKWTVTNHCKRRTQLYHTLLHYKFRLILKVKEELAKHNNSVPALMQNSAFISLEVERFQKLISSAGQKWGGHEQQRFSIWSDDEGDNTSRNGTRRSASATGGGAPSSSASSGHIPTLHRWLSRQQRS